MKPAASIILFTTLAGAAQGLTVVLAAASIAGVAPERAQTGMLWVATGMLLAALAASFFHLGHPLRAWRAALMWRTSWMSREVIVLPAFIALTAAWALAGPGSQASAWLPWLAIATAFLLWHCTAMIYACIRFIQEWAHPLTVVNYCLLGLASGACLAGALAMGLQGDAAFANHVAPWAMALTGLAWLARGLSLRRNTQLKSRSTTQSATGIQAARVVQKSMGMTGGSFNTREFFHGAPVAVFRAAKPAFQVLAFLLPIGLLALAMAGWQTAWLLVAPVQWLGLLIERWFFFAQARHPQNLYYQVVS
ncbi:dimethyl sulfoxide reductase anchor subunit family protein [Ramlibacter sp.]|uniref:dimethyl sulfoxide reductase anchor subunit family protein n=1 Tax=Ramlibacter sp. TaxID=1917967 RepID=UPI0035AF2C11